MHIAFNSETAWNEAPRFVVTGMRSSWNPTATDCGCGCGGHCHATDGLAGLGAAAAMTPEEAVRQAVQGETGPDMQPGSGVYNGMISIVKSGQFNIAAYSPACASQPAPNLQLFSTVSGMALGVSGAAVGISTALHVVSATTGAILGGALMGIGTIIGIFSIIHAHHSAAVKQEQQLGCAGLAAANNYLQIIQQAVASGAQTPQQAVAALQSLLSDFSRFVAPSVKHNPCNANCEQVATLKAIVLYWSSVYESMGTQAAAAATQPADGAAPKSAGTIVPMMTAPGGTSQATTGTPAALGSPGGMPSWLPIAAVVAGIFVLMGK